MRIREEKLSLGVTFNEQNKSSFYRQQKKTKKEGQREMITITNGQIAGFAVIFAVVLVITFIIGYCFGNDRK